MPNSKSTSDETKAAPTDKFQIAAPAITLLKGGGAIRGMGEKFAANPVTGTGSMSVPIATSPGRSGFGPQLSLSYDSGAGNGPFGFGWSLSLPSITRKTDKGLPRYLDAVDSDVFILSGAEDLVPTLTKDAGGKWIPETVPDRNVGGQVYSIKRYRPRIEGLFARIERWTNQIKHEDIFWRSISKDNITTWYGKDENSRIADPSDKSRIFSWLICESFDDKGNVIVYRYKEEDSEKVDAAFAHERNRTLETRKANRYLKRICYGNREPYLPTLTPTTWPQPPDPTAANNPPNYFFEVVFDYEDGHYADETTDADGHVLARPVYKPPNSVKWPARVDPFSTYRAGFEVRTYRLCQRVLMFHHFPDELGTPDYLVRSTDFTYSYEDNPNDARNPIYSFLNSVSQSGYVRQASDSYLKKSLPPLQFEYTKPGVQDVVHDVDPRSLENLPYGLDGSKYQWVDLDGEGLSGILTEQADGWFYKRNLSPLNLIRDNGKEHTEASFAALELVAKKPSLAALSGGSQQLLDLAGDGQLDLVALSGPTPGFFERTQDEGWEPFKPFPSLPNVEWNDPNLKFVDLTGDGHADVLITEDEVFWWYPSLAEDGFGPAERMPQNWDEEKGPRLVFADVEHTIHLADLSGDGLADLVRIRNGEVCYWPNLGYGRFGAKVTMDHAPQFDNPDQFDQKRIRLADIDGSGTTDIIYLHRDGVRLYFNQSGNSWSEPQHLNVFPRVDDLVSIVPTDLLGNSTACLVWSSPLPGDAGRAMRYVDLMGGQKPHLLVKTINNLGAETIVSYAPSTKFYLADKLAGKPWITKLPFPVHCVEKVTVTDKWRQTAFSSTYSYHHGYFDGAEREFRGFGRVEQLDVESYGEFAQGNSASPYITNDKTLYQPPVKTVTWYHTGAVIEHEHILSQFAQEYFPHWFEDLHPDVINVLGDFQENVLPEPDLSAEDLSGEEWREALRACKGMMLRQEVYELDVDALERGEHRPVKLFSTAYHNCHIRRLQAKAINQHAVILVAESEAITYHYELDLEPDSLRPDPRITHTLNLQFDEYANVLQSVAVVYPRLGQFEDTTLPADALALIRRVQQETHLAYTETRYTNDVANPVDPDNYRLRVPCELLTYELTGLSPEDADDLLSPDPRDNRYFTLDEMRRFRLSMVHQAAGEVVPEIAYHQLSNGTAPQKRLVEHARMLFFKDDSTVLKEPLPFGQLGRLGLLYETYKLALTEDLLSEIFGAKLDTAARARLSNAAVSGYLSGSALADRFPGVETDGQYWVRSGIAGFAPDAAQHFYLPERYTDPFDKITTLDYELDLFVASSTDPLGNTTRVKQFDFRVLAPREMQDINDNLSEVFFDVLGLPTAMTVKGKGNEGDSLTGFTDALANPTTSDLATFFEQADLDELQAHAWLAGATARHVYYFGETRNAGGTITWGTHPSCACGIVRETHVSQLGPGEQSLLQTGFEYSDGLGSVVVTKVQAEPEGPGQLLRWVANGKTIFNNKGKPVKQYEPYFSSSGHRFEEPIEIGVTAVIYYDAAGRTVRTELPDGSFSHVDFSPWHVSSYDPNDTVRESKWYIDRNPPELSQPLPRGLEGRLLVTEDQRAAWLAAQHADTPSLTVLDSLGREVIGIAHNRVKDPSGPHIYGGENWKDDYHLTFTKLDAEGKPLWIRDARDNLVMQYITPPVPDNQPNDPVAGFAPCYDIAGNLLFQHSMDAGDRWMLNDAAGKPMLGWDSRGYGFRTEYDSLHRPIRSFVQGGDPTDPTSKFFASEILSERIVYGEQHPEDVQRNLRGRVFKHLDQAGVVTSDTHDFKGNLLRGTRRLAGDYKQTVDWKNIEAMVPADGTVKLVLPALDNALVSLLEDETFTSSTNFDALNRPIQLVAPHSDRPGAKLNVIRPGYNEANLLERVDVWLEQNAEPTILLNPTTANLKAVTNIDYDAEGQRIRIEYNEAGNPVITEYTYDKATFRLIRLLSTRPKHPEGDKRTLQDLSYTYDPIGNITGIRDAAQQTVFFKNSTIEPSNAYAYDALYRLIHAEGREHAVQNNLQRDANNFEPIIGIPFLNSPEALQRYTEEYEYDPVGNILGLHHSGGGAERWVRWYQYAVDSNRLLSTRLPGEVAKLPFYAAAPGYGAKYTYDPHGNMTSMPHLPTMEWDFKNQLSASQQQVNNGGAGEKTYYVYDASGQRVRKVTERQAAAGQMPRRRKERIYLGGFEIYREYENDGDSVTLERETLHVTDDKHRIALVETKTLDVSSPLTPHGSLIRYQFGNHLGSASLELDDHAKIISYEEYYPYGSTSYQAVDASIKAAAKRYRYTGMERDDESGLNYHGMRYYAPWLGRWVSGDPAGIAGGLNLFAYVCGNPLRLLDQSGMEPEPLQLPEETIVIHETPPTSAPSSLDRQVALKNAYAMTRDEMQDRENYEYERQPNALTKEARGKYYRDNPEELSKYYGELQARHNAYWNAEDAALQKTFRRIATAKGVVDVIGGITAVVGGGFALATAVPAGSLVGGGLAGGGTTTTAGAGTAGTIEYTAAKAAQTLATNPAAAAVGGAGALGATVNRVQQVAPALTKVPEVTVTLAREAMAEAPLLSQQGAVYLPKVREYVQLLQQGVQNIDPIKVGNGIIVEGHHRYVAARILGIDIPIQEWTSGRYSVPWHLVDFLE